MAQHDYVLANQSPASFRGDTNNALQAILTINSGTTAPTTTAAGMLWYDTTNGLVKQRNSTDAGWNTLWQHNNDGGWLLRNAGDPNGGVAAWFVGQLCYDTTNSYFWVATAANGTVGGTTWAAKLDRDASDTAKGVVELATSAEASAGTDTVRAITPATLRNGLNAAGSAPVYAARAWVNFNGTGTVAIRASGNVSSITDQGTGQYRVNFTTAMEDADFCAVVSGSGTDSATHVKVFNTAYVDVDEYLSDTNTYTDATYMCVAIFR